MKHAIFKSEFKIHVFPYFRDVEETGKEIILTNRGKPVLKRISYSEHTEEILKSLRNSVIKYDNPTDPVGFDDNSYSGMLANGCNRIISIPREE